jgi:hypothetical protein
MYLLFERHNFWTKLGTASIISVVVYISAIGIYFIVVSTVLGPNVFYCSNPEWLMITGASFIFSVIFFSVGVVVSQDLRSRDLLYKNEVLKKMKQLWVLILTYIGCSFIQLISFGIYMILGSKECVVLIESSLGGTIFLLIFFRGLSDYPLISVLLYQLWKLRPLKDQPKVRLSEGTDVNRDSAFFPRLTISENERNSNNFSIE